MLGILEFWRTHIPPVWSLEEISAKPLSVTTNMAVRAWAWGNWSHMERRLIAFPEWFAKNDNRNFNRSAKLAARSNEMICNWCWSFYHICNHMNHNSVVGSSTAEGSCWDTNLLFGAPGPGSKWWEGNDVLCAILCTSMDLVASIRRTLQLISKMQSHQQLQVDLLSALSCLWNIAQKIGSNDLRWRLLMWVIHRQSSKKSWLNTLCLCVCVSQLWKWRQNLWFNSSPYGRVCHIYINIIYVYYCIYIYIYIL